MPIIGEYAGYQNDPIRTQKRILRDVFHAGDRYFNTGDLLRLDRNYHMYFVDRLGDTFRWKGENVATTEVMERIAVFPGISEVLVYGVKVEGHDGRAGMAAIVLKPDSELDCKGFYKYLTTYLPKYACPLFLRIEPSLAITGSYKYKKSDLAKEGFNPTTIKSPLYYMDISQGEYLPLVFETYSKIMIGNAKL
uniref:Long-chain fatty acid transport protein 6-like n=1 Tax=Saccoglossus kowalevskii TaxID=10224 RepID=A0ABM0MXN9_SACKO|nr:PREDICTED: long-chain fatty acid transport protein 6-like [Saccoglossus kowalevskii]